MRVAIYARYSSDNQRDSSVEDQVRSCFEGRVLAGKSGGGLCFGYRGVRRVGSNGKPVNGEREIDPEAAVVVRRIFAEYVSGRSARQIARAVNGQDLPGPRGGRWTASLTLGNAERETGIL